MRYSGQSITDDRVTISDVVLTDTKLTVDYHDQIGYGHLAATSGDGVRYAGTYGYPEPEDRRRAWFDVYRRRDGGIALVGCWREASDDHPWVIRLDPPAPV